MQLPTQEQFVTDCLSKYRWESIPAGQQWEAAHYPLPACSGEDDTVQLWSADHAVQGLLQSVEYDHQCFHGFRNKHDTDLLTSNYPQYLELFQQLKSHFYSRAGKIGGTKAAVTNQAKGTSIFAPGIASKGGKTSGKTGRGGKKTAELKVGVCGRSAEQMTADGKKGGEISSKIVNAQKWQCLVTGFITNPGCLSHYQKKRGIDTSLRVKLL